MSLNNNSKAKEKVTICVPTLEEMRGIQHHLGDHKLRFKLYLTGMGTMVTASDLGHLIHNLKVNNILHIGIAGAYNRNFKLGEIVEIRSEVLADSGAEKADGSHISFHQIVPSLDGEQTPWKKGVLINPTNPINKKITQATGMTVPFATGSLETLKRRQALGQDVESMEGAALFYTCLYAGCTFHSIRAISNYVEVRDRGAWNIDLALKNLANFLIKYYLD